MSSNSNWQVQFLLDIVKNFAIKDSFCLFFKFPARGFTRAHLAFRPANYIVPETGIYALLLATVWDE